MRIKRYSNWKTSVAKLAKAGVLYVPSLVDGYRQRAMFDHVETHCEFIGFPRSGHSLIGALLNAHPDIAISHELPALRYFYLGFGRRQVYSLILRNAAQSADPERVLGGYRYAVPGQWQGKVRRLRVIGDKEGYGAVLRFASSPRYYRRLRQSVHAKLKFINVIRNPFDIISTRQHRTNEFQDDIGAAIDDFFSLCESITRFWNVVPQGTIFSIRHEVFVKSPAENLARLIEFLGIEATEDYIADCAGIVYASPHRSRKDDTIQWSPALIDRVDRGIARYPFLEGYGFDTP